MRTLCAWSRGWCSRCGPKMCVCLPFKNHHTNHMLFASFISSYFRHHCWCSFVKMERKENCSAHFHAYAILLLFTNEPHVAILFFFLFASFNMDFIRSFVFDFNEFTVYTHTYILEWRILCRSSNGYSNENTLSWIVTRWWLYVSINRN